MSIVIFIVIVVFIVWFVIAADSNDAAEASLEF